MSSSVDRRRRDNNNNNNDNRRRDPTPERDRNYHRRDDDRHHHHHDSNSNRQQNSHHDQQRRQRDYDDCDDHNSRNRNNRDYEDRGRNGTDNRRDNYSDKSNNQRNYNNYNDRDRDRDHHDRSRRCLDDDRNRDRNDNRHDDRNNNRGSSTNNNNNRRGVDDRNSNNQDSNRHHHHHHRHRGDDQESSSAAPRQLGLPPSYYRCHICTKANHWVIQCPTLTLNPGNRKFFPHLSVSRGCAACGQRGHESAACPNQVALCLECRGIHFPDTKKCPFARPASIWHEFLDEATGLPYYVEQQQENRNTRLGILPVPVVAKVCDFFTSDEGNTNNNNTKNVDEVKKNGEEDALALATTWSPPQNPGDVILWYCDHCKHLLPVEKHSVCPCCKLARFR